MTAADQYRYVVEHPETFGPIGSREEDEEPFGGGAGDAWDNCTIEILMSGDRQAVFAVSPRSAALERDGRSWAALDGPSERLAVHARSDNLGRHREGAPVRIRFPALPRVASTQERLTARQINRKPEPAADPIKLTPTLAGEGRTQEVAFTFDRVAVHPPLPPNPLYWLDAAHGRRFQVAGDRTPRVVYNGRSEAAGATVTPSPISATIPAASVRRGEDRSWR